MTTIPTARPGRRRPSPIWLLPMLAAAVAAYLGYASWAGRGPLITINFDNAQGLTAGQTQIRYKSVPIGIVDSIRLFDNLSRVQVGARMGPAVRGRLTGSGRFWVVRPRLSASQIAGLETIVSGAYIDFDPGPPSHTAARLFEGLEEPPGIRSGEPGSMMRLRTGRLGALRPGSTVMFRDVPAGEVLSLDPLAPDGGSTLDIFIRAPFDRQLRAGSRFWNSSGISANFGPAGLKVEVESLRAALTGGIAFDTPGDLLREAVAPEGTSFTLHDSQEAAILATSAKRLEFITYLDGSARGLAIGSPVEIRGIRVGSITRLDLVYDVATRGFVVQLRMVVDPGHIVRGEGRPPMDITAATAQLVAEGLRVRLRSGNLLTGQKVLSIDQVPEAAPAVIRIEDGVIVLPGLGDDSDDLMANLGTIAARIERFPIEEIGRNLNAALAAINGLAGGPELRGAVSGLSGGMAQLQALLRKVDAGLSPLLGRLPAIAGNLDQALRGANAAAGSIERGYGADSPLSRQLAQSLQQVSEAARALRLLAELLERHPEALVRGRAE